MKTGLCFGSSSGSNNSFQEYRDPTNKKNLNKSTNLNLPQMTDAFNQMQINNSRYQSENNKILIRPSKLHIPEPRVGFGLTQADTGHFKFLALAEQNSVTKNGFSTSFGTGTTGTTGTGSIIGGGFSSTTTQPSTTPFGSTSTTDGMFGTSQPSTTTTGSIFGSTKILDCKGGLSQPITITPKPISHLPKKADLFEGHEEEQTPVFYPRKNIKKLLLKPQVEISPRLSTSNTPISDPLFNRKLFNLTNVSDDETHKIDNQNENKPPLWLTNMVDTNENIPQMIDAISQINIDGSGDQPENLIRPSKFQPPQPHANQQKTIFLANQSTSATARMLGTTQIEETLNLRLDLPLNWDLFKEEKCLILLDPKSDEFKRVETIYLDNGLSSHLKKIISIQRIQNEPLYYHYIIFRNELKKKNPNANVEKTVFHGTSAESIENIWKSGFNRSYCGKNATVYGQGVCFAEKSSYSHNYTDIKNNNKRTMFLCKIAVTKMELGNSSMKVPPNDCDHTVDNINNPTIFVVYNDSQAYPEYLLTYE